MFHTEVSREMTDQFCLIFWLWKCQRQPLGSLHRVKMKIVFTFEKQPLFWRGNIKSSLLTFQYTLNAETCKLVGGHSLHWAKDFFPRLSNVTLYNFNASFFISEVLRSVFQSHTRYSWPTSDNIPRQSNSEYLKGCIFNTLECVQISKYTTSRMTGLSNEDPFTVVCELL